MDSEGRNESELLEAAAAPVATPAAALEAAFPAEPVDSRPISVTTRGLSKAYGGKLALDHLNLDIRKGDIFGYIGPNGAGKTTTIRILSALLLPSSGNASIEGVDVVAQPREIKELVGYMPDSFGVYDNMTLYEYLDFFAAAYRIRRAKRKQIIDDVLALTDLGGKRDDVVSAFSRGMKQRACLAKTLLHDPQVLILDEPASGLDPRARIEFRELLKELQRMGKTILVSSHILTELSTICNSVGMIEASGLDPRARIEFRELLKELQRMGKTILVSSHILTELSTICNSVGMIERGKLIASGEVKKILAGLRTHREFCLELLDPADAPRAEAWFGKQPGVQNAKSVGGSMRIALTATEPEIASLLEGLVAERIRLTEFREEVADLETAFMTLTKGELA